MPKQVDHAERRELLADALWRVVMRDGIESASLRGVAAEAGWSVGSLRHYFATQSELLSFAMELVMQRVAGRIRAPPRETDRRRAAERLLHEVLPLDDERRAEMQVWLAFTTRALVEPELRALRDRAHVGLRELCYFAAELVGACSPAREAERLHAIVDGLALHAVLDPEVTTPARQVELLALEFDAMAR